MFEKTGDASHQPLISKEVNLTVKTPEKIRALRLSKGITQEELGNAIGVQKAAINKYETGRIINIKQTTLQNLANALGVTPADLLDDPEDVVTASHTIETASNAKKQYFVEPADGWTSRELKEIENFKRYLLYKRNM